MKLLSEIQRLERQENYILAGKSTHFMVLVFSMVTQTSQEWSEVKVTSESTSTTSPTWMGRRKSTWNDEKHEKESSTQSLSPNYRQVIFNITHTF